MKKYVFFTYFSLIHLLCHAYEINVDTVVVDFKDSQVEQVIVTINNTGEDTLWIWFDHNSFTDEAHYIKQRFFKRPCSECFSLFDIATDPNMGGNWWELPTSIQLFTKCLMPKQNFVIILLQNTKNANLSHKTENWKKLLKIYTQRIILKYCEGIDTHYGTRRISYPYDAIVYPISIPF